MTTPTLPSIPAWTWQDRLVNLDELPPDSLLVGRAPTRKEIELTARFGVIEPVVLVQPDPHGPFQVVDGRRRIRRARAAGLRSIPARVHVGPPPGPVETLCLVLNTDRSENLAAELDAALRLVQNRPLEDVAGQLGLTRAQLERILRLSTLNPDLLQAVFDGRLSEHLALRIRTLPQAIQADLADHLQRAGRLTQRDVTRAVQTRTSLATQNLMLAAPELGWQATVAGHLRAALAALPGSELELAQAIYHCLALLGESPCPDKLEKPVPVGPAQATAWPAG